MLVQFGSEQYEVVPTHDLRQWYMTVLEVARAYGVDRTTISYHLREHAAELRDGIEVGSIVGNPNNGPREYGSTILFREGVIKLGFFVRSQQAAAFRQFATDLIVQHLEQQGVLTADQFAAFVAQQNSRFDRIEQVAGGLRQEVDELKDLLNLFLTDNEREQIQYEINLTKVALQMDGRAVIGKIKSTLNTNSVYGVGRTKEIVNFLRNMRGEGLRTVK